MVWISLGTLLFSLLTPFSFESASHAFLSCLALYCSSKVSILAFHLLAAPLVLFVLAVLFLEFVNWKHKANSEMMRRVWNDVGRLRMREDVRLYLQTQLESRRDENIELKSIPALSPLPTR